MTTTEKRLKIFVKNQKNIRKYLRLKVTYYIIQFSIVQVKVYMVFFYHPIWANYSIEANKLNLIQN